MEMIFKQLNPEDCLSYLFGSADTKECIIIDPLLIYADEYLALLKKEGLKLTHVIDTHTHADHISGGAYLMDKTNCIYAMHESSPQECLGFRVPTDFECHIGGVSVRAIHTPGHTRNSMCLVFPDRIFTGDTLFLDDGGAGRDDLPGGDSGAHWESLERLKTLPDSLMVYPGHEYRGRKPSTLGEQKKRNPHMQWKSKEEFVRQMAGLKLEPAEWMKNVVKVNAACTRDANSAHVVTGKSACEVKFGAPTCMSGAAGAAAAYITPAKVQERLSSGEKIVILDVREPHELTSNLGHIAGAVNIPIDKIEARLSELDRAKGSDIVTVCRSGGRASSAAKFLKGRGFERVFVMEGGMTAWNKEELPTKK